MTTLTLAADLMELKVIATIVFFLIWVAILIRLVVSRSRKYDDAARLPLHDDRILEPRDAPNGNGHHV